MMKQHMNSGWQWVKRGLRRLSTLPIVRLRASLLAVIIVLSTIGYTAGILLDEARYQLSADSQQLIGKVNRGLAKKLALDAQLASYRFNAENIAPDMTGETNPAKIAALLSHQKQQTGAATNSENLYSVDLPINPKKGMTIYDRNTRSSIKLIPEFSLSNGRSEDGRIVYPVDGGGQAVYSVKGNGVKEDIVLTEPRGDELSFSYRLSLPTGLEARIDEQGNLGIYSVDPTVLTALANGSDSSRLQDVQRNGSKTHLAYVIPAPTIVQSGHGLHKARASYHLEGSRLTVTASGLQALRYPISIDPSVVVTSTTDFSDGNSEGNISFDTDAISRLTPTAGTIAQWSYTGVGPTVMQGAAAALYNGRIYTLGGDDGTTSRQNVTYSSINADGSLGPMTLANMANLATGRYNFAAVAYNGYMYAIGGKSGASPITSVEYGKIQSDGTIRSWSAATGLPAARSDHDAVAYNGYIYVVGGYVTSAASADVQYASVKGDGSIGPWTTTTGLPSARQGLRTVAYNGYVYALGGFNGSYLNDVVYAQIGSTGALGSWLTGVAFSTGRAYATTVFYGGYIYLIGGMNGSDLNDVQYALLAADGTPGAWMTTVTSINASGGVNSHSSVAYNGRIYTICGSIGGARTDDVYTATIDLTPASVMTIAPWAATTTLGLSSGSATNKAATRELHSMIAYNGYMYVIGGLLSGSTVLQSVHSAPINANGTLGTWAANTALPAVRYGQRVVIVNGYMYVVGGQSSASAFVNTVYYASIGAGGTIGTWATTSALGTARSRAGVTTYNGYIYAVGGVTTGGTSLSSAEYAPINANGTLGTWAATTGLSLSAKVPVIAYNGYIYLLDLSAKYAPLNADGTIGAWTSTGTSSGSLGPTAELVQGHFVILGDTTSSAAVKYAKIKADATLSSWTAGPSFTAARTNQASTFYNGYLYVSGGNTGAATVGDVQYASAVYGLPASTIGTAATWQAASSSIPTGVDGHASVVYNNYIYVVAGYDRTNYRNDVRYAPINANGTIGTWTTSPSTLGTARSNFGAAAYNGYLYVVGGSTTAASSSPSTIVEYAAINADGSLGTWQVTASFTTARMSNQSFVYNGKIYVLGGYTGSVYLNDVQYAPLNANGTVGTWQTTTAMPDAASGFRVGVYGGRVYLSGGFLGGTGATTDYLKTIRYATINSDGTLGSWTTSPSQFTSSRYSHGMAMLNGYMYIVGGANGSQLGLTRLGDVQYAPINADGTVGTWQSTTSYTAISGAPTGIYGATLTAYNGKLYHIGGYDGTIDRTDIYTVTLNAPLLRGVYTKAIDLGYVSTVNAITANGFIPLDKTVYWFRSAGTDGLYGAWQPLSSLSGTPLIGKRYLMLKADLDDSSGTAYSATTNNSSVTDITIDYLTASLSPENRLRHNKFFDDTGTLQPLQTQ